MNSKFNYNSIDEFLKKSLNNDELYNKALSICQQQCIMDIDTLLQFSEEELQQMQFPYGIIKKFQPHLRTCSQDELNELTFYIKEFLTNLPEKIKYVQEKLSNQQRLINRLKVKLQYEQQIHEQITSNLKTFENINKQLQEYENLNLFSKINQFQKIKKLVNDHKDYIMSTNSSLLKTYISESRNVFIFKIDAQKPLEAFQNYDKKNGLQWFSPKSSEDAQKLIEICTQLNKKLDQVNTDNQYWWIMTHGVATDPKNKLFGGYKVDVEGDGAQEGDDNIQGKCNGTAFTCIRKMASSFANPNIKFKKPCCWNTQLNFGFLVLQNQ